MLWRFGFGDILSVCVGLLRQLYIIRIVFFKDLSGPEGCLGN